MGYTDCIFLYPILIFNDLFQIEFPQTKTSFIPHARNDFISTDITEGKSSILSKLVQSIHNVRHVDVTWFRQYFFLCLEDFVNPLLKVMVIVSLFLLLILLFRLLLYELWCR